jgi:hypothetical protein
MNCSYCGNPIEKDGIVSGDLNFCNNLCRYLFSKNGTSVTDNLKSSEEKYSQPEAPEMFLNNLDFNINLPGIESGRLLVRAGYFRGPKVFLDDKKLKPAKKQFFKRTKTYLIENDKKIYFEIKVKKRFFDAVPVLFVNGEKTKLVKNLKWYEYIWIFIPLLLFYFGYIGGFIGGAAAFTNSIIFRKIKKSALKYTMVILNTGAAFYIALNIVIFLLPYITEFQFNLQKNETTETLVPELVPLTKHIWEVYKITDSLDTDLSAAFPQDIGSKRYFFHNGTTNIRTPQGKIFYSNWKSLEDNKFINLTGPGINDTIKIETLTDSRFIYSFKNLLVICTTE